MCYCELGSIPIVVALFITQPTMRQPLSDYLRYINVHHKTYEVKSVGFGYWILRFASHAQYVGYYAQYVSGLTITPLNSWFLFLDD